MAQAQQNPQTVQAPAEDENHIIAERRAKLAALRAAGAKAALMTGSGAAVYGVFETRAAAEAARTALLQSWPRAWAVHPVRCGAHVCRGR